MQSIIDKITEWLKGILIDGIVENLSGMFDNVNTQVGEIAGEVGKTPLQWNSGVFSMIQTLSETVIIPIAGLILAFVMCYELIQMVIDRNNLHDMDTWMFFKWVFKTFVAVLLVTNTFNIIMGIFDAAQHVVNQSACVIISDAGIDLATAIPDMEARLQAMELGPLFGLWFQSIFVGITMKALSVCIFIIIYGRMLEIYSVEIWKRFRKWGGIPTGITQNIKDLLASREIENIFENSDFIYMLNQASGDRQILAKQLNISPYQLSYVTHSGEGEGLLFYGNIILPFTDKFPKNTELYRIMTTRPNEKYEG